VQDLRLAADENGDADEAGGEQGTETERFAKKHGGEGEREEWLKELNLTDAGDTTDREAVIPRKEAEERADHANVSKASP
jgi:hypothetical protein